MELVGLQARRRAGGIVVSELDVRKTQVLFVSLPVDDHSQYLDHVVVHPLNALVTVGMIGTWSKLAHTQQVIYSM